MSLNAISTSLSTAQPALTLQAHGHGHGHRRGAHLETGSASSGSAATTGGSEIGQLPVGVSSALFGNVLQSLGQSIGAQASASSAAVGTVNASGGVATAAGTSIPAAGGTALAVPQNLSSTFQQLLSGSSGAAAANAATSASAGTASNQSSNAALQSFLNNFLQTLQAQGVPALNTLGNHVNANV